MGVNSLPKTVFRQRRDCDLNPGPSAPESSTLTTRLPSHQLSSVIKKTHNSTQHARVAERLTVLIIIHVSLSTANVVHRPILKFLS